MDSRGIATPAAPSGGSPRPSPAWVLGRLRSRARATTLLQCLAFAALATACGALVLENSLVLAGIAAGSGLAALGATLPGRRRRILDESRLAQHLDRCFPELEESAALLVQPPQTPSVLQKLQLQRIAPRWSGLLTERQRWLPPLPWQGPALLLSLALLVTLLGDAPFWDREATSPLMPDGTIPGPAAGAAAPELLGITITPPAYTGLPERQQHDFNLEVPEGSVVSWRLRWPGARGPVLVFNDGQEHRVLPTMDETGQLAFEYTAGRTGLYRLVGESPDPANHGGPGGPAAEIYTLTVELDAPPSLRVLEPSRTTLELPRDAPPRFVSQVRVRDDYGIGAVEIRASVAKGSGEGVKFRDELFAFDSSIIDDDGIIYSREWSLDRLGMEPGDEVYFFAVARDNREPEPNEARSDTVVVRWLDEEAPLELADGFGIDVLPEYYKSQRQIIIETEQLIADRDAIDNDLFDETSRALAQAQAELKERYGQYLGDEFGEGEGASFGAPGDAGSRDADDEQHDDEEDHAGHDHGSEAAAAQVDTRGNAADLIERFAHQHGAAEIGPITRRNPVGLMKRSLSNMWQAELQLHLSAPEKALAYEYEALKYLDLARQADRIYTRRLGFEPPPVTEERRLTGELDDINSRVRRQSPEPDPNPGAMAEALFSQLGAATPGQAIDPETRALLVRAADHLTALSQQRPALISQVVNIERLLQADQIDPAGCEHCLEELRETAWSLSGSGEAGPDRRPPAPSTAIPGPADRYREALQRLQAEPVQP